MLHFVIQMGIKSESAHSILIVILRSEAVASLVGIISFINNGPFVKSPMKSMFSFYGQRFRLVQIKIR